MMADADLKLDSARSCCALIKQRYLKAEEKRNALRKAVNLLDQQVTKLQTENLNIKRTYEEEQEKTKANESAIRAELENDILRLKSEIASLQKNKVSSDQDVVGEVILLRTRVSEGEEEINRLKELLEKERKRGESEKKKVEAEKEKTAEAWKLVGAEKKKAEEERGVANVERSRSTEFQLRLEASEAEIERLKGLLEKEMESEDSYKKKAEAEKRKAAEAWKLLKSEKTKAEEAGRAADIERNRAEECRVNLELSKAEANEVRAELISERSKTEEALRRLEVEKQKTKREKKRVESAMAKAEEQRNCAEANEVRAELISERSKTEEALRRLEVEKQKTKREKKRVESAIAKAEEQRNCAEEEKKKLIDEKNHSYNLSRQLEEEKQRNKVLEKEMQEIVSSRKIEKAHEVPFDTNGNAANANIKFLKKQLTLEKMRLKHAKRTAKFEKMRNDFLEQEVFNLKQDFVSFACRLNTIDDCFSHDREGIDAPAKGKCAFTASSPVKLRDKKLGKGSTTPRFSEMPVSRINENLAVEAENNVRSSIQGHAKSSSNGHDSIEVVGGEPGDSRKRKQMEDAELLTEYFCSKDNRSYAQKEKLLSLHDSLVLKNTPAANCSKSDRKSNVLGNGGCPTSILQDDLHARQNRSSKKIKLPQKQKFFVETCNKEYVTDDVQKQSDTLQTEVSKGGGILPQDVPLDKCLIETVQACRDEKADSIDDGTATFFGNMTTEDYMKLLDLDDADEEQLYRTAMETPLSPTLAEIEMPNMEALEMNDSIDLVEGLHQVVANEEDTLVPSGSFDVNDLEIGSNGFKFRSPCDSDASLLRQLKEPDNQFEDPEEEGGFHISNDMAKMPGHQVLKRSAENAGAKEVAISGTRMEVPCTGSGKQNHEGLSKYIVAFPNTNEKSSIARIISFCERYISRSFMVSQKVWVVEKILPALAMEQNLLPQEKASALFSLLLHNFSVVTSMNFRNFSSGDSTSCSDSFLMHMKTVMSDVKVKDVLLESCQLDTLLNLIECFLIDKRILVYNDVSYDQNLLCDSGSTIIVDDITTNVSFKAATTDQLVSGSIILASICATTYHIGFICEATYNILRMGRSDSCLMLKMLHAFASVCGTKYFTLSNYSLIMTIVKSLVTVLERGNVTAGVLCASCLPSASESQLVFPTCAQCLFSEDVISVDEVLRFLLEKLQNHAVPRTRCLPMLLLDSSNWSARPCMERAEPNTGREVGFGGLDKDIDASGFISKHGTLVTYQSNSVDSRTLNHFSHILSLVELIACYMEWDWTRTKIVPQLLKMLELSISEEFSAAIVTLLGQVGRFGIDDSGHDLLGVEELRCSLSALLNQNATRKWGLPTQFAALHALIGLLSIDFGKLIKGNKEFPAYASEPVHANLIELWFSQLTEEQKSLCFDIFLSAEVQ